MKRLLKEPLLHFLILGALVFGAHEVFTRGSELPPQSIVVTQAQVESLAASFARAWRRPPTRSELDGLIREHVREEVYYREALALGLDRDDTVVRRRLRQKMEFLLIDPYAQPEPSENDLRRYLADHPESFRVDRTYSFSQVFLSPERHGDRLEAEAGALLARLRREGNQVDLSVVGDPMLLEHGFDDVSATDVGKLFGDKFEDRLGELEPGVWQGPIESGYGVHLVLVRKRTEGRTAEFDEVRDAVRSHWLTARQEQGREDLFQSLLSRYTVTIEAAEPAPAGGSGPVP